MSKTYYALQQKKRTPPYFICVSKDAESLEGYIKYNYNAWCGCQLKGSNPTMGDYMQGFERVKFTVEVL